MFSFQNASNCWFFRKPWGILDIDAPILAHIFQTSHSSCPSGTPQSPWCQDHLMRWDTRGSAQGHLQFIGSIWTAELSYLQYAKVQVQWSLFCHFFPIFFSCLLKWHGGRSASTCITRWSNRKIRCSLAFVQISPISMSGSLAAPLTWLFRLINTTWFWGDSSSTPSSRQENAKHSHFRQLLLSFSLHPLLISSRRDWMGMKKWELAWWFRRIS